MSKHHLSVLNCSVQVCIWFEKEVNIFSVLVTIHIACFNAAIILQSHNNSIIAGVVSNLNVPQFSELVD